ncbi:MAG: CARDB domain-containing protein, partial [Methanosarcinaceae archaeon]
EDVPFTSYDPDLTWSFLNEGSFLIELTVTDNDGAISTDEVMIIVSSPELVLEIDMDPPLATIGHPIYFEGFVYGDQIEISLYEWDLDGDGYYEISNSENLLFSQAFFEAGTYEIFFRVVFPNGENAYTSAELIILDAIVVQGNINNHYAPGLPVPDLQLILFGDQYSDEWLLEGTSYSFTLPYEGHYEMFTIVPFYCQFDVDLGYLTFGTIMNVDLELYMELTVTVEGNGEPGYLPLIVNGGYTDVTFDIAFSDPQNGQAASYEFWLDDQLVYTETSEDHLDGAFDGSTVLSIDTTTETYHYLSCKVTTDEGAYGYGWIDMPVTTSGRITRAPTKHVATLTLTEDGEIPISDVTVILKKSNDKNGGRSSTDENGQVSFEKRSGTYYFLVRYCKYDFITDPFELTEDMNIDFQIPHVDYIVSVKAGDNPIIDRKVKVFTAAERSIRMNDLSDENGQVIFHLPDGTGCPDFDGFKFRVRLKAVNYWSDPSSGGLVTIDVPTTERTITVIADGEVDGLRVNVYTKGDVFSGIFGITDADGIALIDVPSGSFKFRVEYMGYLFTCPKTDGDATITITSQTRTCTVTMDDEGLEGLTVNVFNSEDVFVGASAVTDENGQVSFSLPSNKEYYYEVRYGDSYFQSDINTGDPATMVITAMEFTIGVVLDTEALTYVPVTCYDSAGNFISSKFTDYNGLCAFTVPYDSSGYEFMTTYLGTEFYTGLVTTDTNISITTVDHTVTVKLIDVDDASETLVDDIIVSVLSEYDGYIGVLGNTESGDVTFSLIVGESYKYKVEYMGYEFVTDAVSTDANIDFDVREYTVDVLYDSSYLYEQSVTVVKIDGEDKTDITALETVGTSPSSTFVLPSGTDYSYEFRTHLYGYDFTADAGASQAVTISIPSHTVTVTLTDGTNTLDLEVPIFVDNDEGLYTGIETDTVAGTIDITVPDMEYEFMCLYFGHYYSSGTAGTSTSVDILITNRYLSAYATVGGYDLYGQTIALHDESGEVATAVTDDDYGDAGFTLDLTTDYSIKTTHLGVEFSQPVDGSVETISIPGAQVTINVIDTGTPLGDIPINVYMLIGTTQTLVATGTTLEGGADSFLLLSGYNYMFEATIDTVSYTSERTYVFAYTDMSVNIGLLPDLNVDRSDIVMSPTLPFEGDKVTVTATISNEGNSDSCSFNVEIYDMHPSEMDAQLIHEETITSLAASSSVSVSGSWWIYGFAQLYDVHVIVDRYDEIVESDEEDNIATRHVATRGMLIDGNAFDTCTDAIRVVDSSGFINDNEISGVSGTGIYLERTTALTEDDVFIKVYDNVVEGTATATGLHILNWDGPKVIGNQISLCAVGIDLDSSAAIKDCTLTDNAIGIDIIIDGATIENCDLDLNGIGIQIDDCNPYIYRAEFDDNNLDMRIVGDCDPVIKGFLLNRKKIDFTSTTDTDSDTLIDMKEKLFFGTDPNSPNTDGDGFTDPEEINELIYVFEAEDHAISDDQVIDDVDASGGQGVMAYLGGVFEGTIFNLLYLKQELDGDGKYRIYVRARNTGDDDAFLAVGVENSWMDSQHFLLSNRYEWYSTPEFANEQMHDDFGIWITSESDMADGTSDVILDKVILVKNANFNTLFDYGGTTYEDLELTIASASSSTVIVPVPEGRIDRATFDIVRSVDFTQVHSLDISSDIGTDTIAGVLTYDIDGDTRMEWVVLTKEFGSDHITHYLTYEYNVGGNTFILDTSRAALVGEDVRAVQNAVLIGTNDDVVYGCDGASVFIEYGDDPDPGDTNTIGPWQTTIDLTSIGVASSANVIDVKIADLNGLNGPDIIAMYKDPSDPTKDGFSIIWNQGGTAPFVDSDIVSMPTMNPGNP